MSGYTPLKITGMSTGLVQSREEFLLPDDAYPTLENAYVWRERIKRKQGMQLLGRLQRVLLVQPIGNNDGGGSFTGNLISILSLEAGSEIRVGSVVISDGVNTYTDNGMGVLVGVPAGSGTINYSTGAVTISGGVAGAALTATFKYYPNLPVMGLRTRELTSLNNEMMVAFDTKYAYRVGASGFQEFISGTTWSGTDSNFFWSTNYWTTPFPANNKLFWVTNFSGTAADPIRYTDGTAWVDFAPTINAAGDKLTQCQAMLPFRSRMVAFNTLEGGSLATSAPYPQRIRWSEIGNPISDISTIFPLAGDVVANAWRDDIRGKGGYLNIPTSEDIVAVGFVRDNLVIYCERSTWQLRYTGRTISPFQIEKVNTELGAESTFSSIQFDTSLVGIGDKGIVECDSYKSERIDIKIPDLVFEFDNNLDGPQRVHGIRDQQQKLAYWTYPYKPGEIAGDKFPNRRLVYNYENDSWAIFTDSFTCFGTYQPQSGRTWQNAGTSWVESNFSWANRPSLFPSITAGNQQGYVETIGGNLLGLTTNEVSLTITDIQGNDPLPTVIKSVNHNLETGQIISINFIPTGTPFATSLNDNKFYVLLGDSSGANPLDYFRLLKYNPATDAFTLPQTDAPAVYIGGGEIAVRDNFSIVSKKFNFIDQGQNIQLGFIDILMDTTDAGAISLNVYLDYNDNSPINVLPENINPSTSLPDTFFNSIVPTTAIGGIAGTKNSQRVYCPVRGAFITLEWTLSNLQMIGIEQESDVQIDYQVLWMRQAGRLQTNNI